MRIAIILNRDKLSGKLTRLFTGCYAYHIGFVSADGQRFYDQHWLFRVVPWPGRYDPRHVRLFDCPFPLTEEELREEILAGVRALCGEKSLLEALYGWRDYVMFAFRWVFHLFGKSTPNFGGTVCSGRMRDIGARRGWLELGAKEDAEPSPCDWLEWFAEREGYELPLASVQRTS